MNLLNCGITSAKGVRPPSLVAVSFEAVSTIEGPFLAGVQ